MSICCAKLNPSSKWVSAIKLRLLTHVLRIFLLRMEASRPLSDPANPGLSTGSTLPGTPIWAPEAAGEATYASEHGSAPGKGCRSHGYRGEVHGLARNDASIAWVVGSGAASPFRGTDPGQPM